METQLSGPLTDIHHSWKPKNVGRWWRDWREGGKGRTRRDEEIGGQRGWEEGGQGNDGDGEERSGSFSPQERGGIQSSANIFCRHQ